MPKSKSKIIVSRRLVNKVNAAFKPIDDDDEKCDALYDALAEKGVIHIYGTGDTNVIFEAGAELGLKAGITGSCVVISYGDPCWACVAKTGKDAVALVVAAVATTRR